MLANVKNYIANVKKNNPSLGKIRSKAIYTTM